MGPLSQYPRDPNGKVPARLTVGDTPLSTIAHEMGHLFLAYASVEDEAGGIRCSATRARIGISSSTRTLR